MTTPPSIVATAADHGSRSQDLDYHAGRVLILLSAFTREGKGIDSLTKLAKLDFLLRYPVLLERLSRAVDAQPLDLLTQPTDEERLAVESRMVRYKYGPWDDRYYPILGMLIGTGLIRPEKSQRRTKLRATPLGIETAAGLATTGEWHTTALRCAYLHKNFNKTGNSLKDLIYKNLPEVVDRPHRSII
jgi:hypothetical protein